ncbi:MAG: PLP-dependent aminotransferase family protein, partial [Verrucomicrobia bacterium]|nr:PLP-dependent aminotransferase family protein [Verrucomicrobiota bacterium]
MAREQSLFIMLDSRRADRPLYRQIYEAIRMAILSGEFGRGKRLAATRALARDLGVSRITVLNAYEQLLAEGYLDGKSGAGTFVAAELPDNLLRTETIKQSRQKKTDSPLHLSPFGRKLAMKDIGSIRARTIAKFQPFQNGLTAVDRFPFEIWSRIAARVHRNPSHEVLGYGDPQGYFPLREAIAAHLTSARGVNCSADQVIITSGAQQALDLAARIFLSEKDSVLIEDPCYQEARSTFAATGAKIIPVPVDAEGLNLGATKQKAKLIYVTPSHQYPLGVTMSLPRRLALLEWARTRNAWIIEDDYDSEFRYAGRPLASLQGLDQGGRVIYVGTFSKTIFPSMRIGCAVVPPDLVGIFTAARALNDTHSSLIDQAILTKFISDGHFVRHVRRMRTLYEQRQQTLVAECEKNLAGLLEVKKADAGMHLVGWLPEGVSDRAISQRTAGQNLKLAPISAYCAKELPRGGLILGYTAFEKNQIKEGVKKL